MKKELGSSVAWAGAICAVALGATFASRLGYIDHDAVTRLVFGVIGLSMIWFGNRMPKIMVPAPACAGQARRVASWSLVLSGLAYAGLWVFAPISVAAWAGMVAVLTGLAVTLGYCLMLRSRVTA